MQDLYWLDDAAWSRIEPLLPRGRRGARRVDDRRVPGLFLGLIVPTEQPIIDTVSAGHWGAQRPVH